MKILKYLIGAIICLGLGVLLGWVVFHGSTKVVGSSTLVSNGSTDFTGEIGMVDPTNSQVLVQGFLYGKMPAAGAATSTSYIKNSTGHAIYVDTSLLGVQMSGTASGTITVYMGTSTATGLAAYTTAPPNGFIQGFNVATSTSALYGTWITSSSTANSFYIGTTTIIMVSWMEPFGCQLSGTGACESATSTARGYDATYRIPYFYFKTP